MCRRRNEAQECTTVAHLKHVSESNLPTLHWVLRDIWDMEGWRRPTYNEVVVVQRAGRMQRPSRSNSPTKPKPGWRSDRCGALRRHATRHAAAHHGRIQLPPLRGVMGQEVAR